MNHNYELKYRKSAPERILVGTGFCWGIGILTGKVLSIADDKPQLFRLWLRGSLKGSLCFFIALELVNSYCQSLDLRLNFHVQNSLAGYFTYKLLNLQMRHSDLNLKTSQIRQKAVKYSLLLTLTGCFFHLWIQTSKKSLLFRLDTEKKGEGVMGGMSLIKIGKKPDFVMVLKQDQKEELEMYNREARERLKKALKMLMAQ